MAERRLLLLEDHPFQREYLANLLRAIPDAQVETASNAQLALALCQQEAFQLVVTDLGMPDMDGIQFIQKLAQLRHRPLLALVSSSSRRMMTAARCMAELLGMVVVDVMPKPVTPKDIEHLLLNLERAKAREALKHATPAVPVAADRRELMRAIRAGEICAWFQPKISMDTGLIVGAEALVRWKHPVHGMLGPDRFMPLLEEADLEVELLTHMTAEAVRAQHALMAQGHRLSISINLPTHLLEHRDLPDELATLVAGLGGEPEQLCFELLESSMTDRASDYYAGACRLRLKGFGLAQDDFGRGVSSFHSLSRIPFSEVKIDRSLVKGCSADQGLYAALSSVISLGRQLGVVVVAEGVENSEDLAVLRKLGCQCVQGFFLSPPIALEQLLSLLKRPAATILGPG